MAEFDPFILAVKFLLALGLPLLIFPLCLYLEQWSVEAGNYRVRSLRSIAGDLLRPLVHMIKLFFKQDHLDPLAKNGPFLRVFPFIYLLLSILPLLVVSFCGPLPLRGKTVLPELWHMDWGLLYVYLILCLSPLAVLMASWRLQEVYALLFGMRKVYQASACSMIMSLSFLAMIISYGGPDVHEIVEMQKGQLWGVLPSWGLFRSPLGALIFLLGPIIFQNKSPGRSLSRPNHSGNSIFTNYTSMRFIYLQVAEYLFFFEMVWLFVALFMGGHNILPLLDLLARVYSPLLIPLQVISTIVKMGVVVILINLAQSFLPLLRSDQIMRISWKVLFPISILNFLGTVFYKYLNS